jgi:hypothetical protein
MGKTGSEEMIEFLLFFFACLGIGFAIPVIIWATANIILKFQSPRRTVGEDEEK